MTTHEAHEILGLRPGAGPDERLAAYQKQREMLEVKLGRSPTPGLKAKYRGALERLDKAYEVLELADDPGDLPALRPPQIDLPHVKQLEPSQQVAPLLAIQADVPPPPEPRPPVIAEESEPERPFLQQPLNSSKKTSSKAMVGFVVLSVALAAGGVVVWQRQAKETEALRIAEAADSAGAEQEDATRAADMVKLAEATKKAEEAAQARASAEKRARETELARLAAEAKTAAAETAEAYKWETDFEAASGRSKAEQKPMFVFFTGSDWCAWCILLKKEVFDTQEFKDYAAKNLVLVKIDFPRDKKAQSDEEKAQNSKLLGKHDVQGYPTILLLNDKGREVARTGYKKGGPDAYIEHLKELLK